jgi:hypothetical protein
MSGAGALQARACSAADKAPIRRVEPATTVRTARQHGQKYVPKLLEYTLRGGCFSAVDASRVRGRPRRLHGERAFLKDGPQFHSGTSNGSSPNAVLNLSRFPWVLGNKCSVVSDVRCDCGCCVLARNLPQRCKQKAWLWRLSFVPRQAAAPTQHFPCVDPGMVFCRRARTGLRNGGVSDEGSPHRQFSWIC